MFSLVMQYLIYYVHQSRARDKKKKQSESTTRFEPIDLLHNGGRFSNYVISVY